MKDGGNLDGMLLEVLTKSFISVTIIHHQSLATGVKNQLLKCINLVKYVNQRIQVFNKSL